MDAYIYKVAFHKKTMVKIRERPRQFFGHFYSVFPKLTLNF